MAIELKTDSDEPGCYVSGAVVDKKIINAKEQQALSYNHRLQDGGPRIQTQTPRAITQAMTMIASADVPQSN